VVGEELKAENLKADAALGPTHHTDYDFVQLRGRSKKKATLDGPVRHFHESPALRDVPWLSAHRFNRRKSSANSAVRTRRFPLSVTAPADGQTVSAPFAVEGSTVPGARVEIAITVETAESPPQRSTAFVGAMRDGLFRYTFWQPSLQAARYTITVTAYVRGGDPETATVIVVNPAPADGGTPHP